jgi:hypothetical protein
LRQREDEIAALGLEVVVVTFQGESTARTYAKETKLRWPVLVDVGLTLYRAFGMGRGRVRDILGPASWIAYGKLILRGRRPRPAAGDPYQLGGDVLIDPRGIVRLHHVGSGPADRPPVESILATVREERGNSEHTA